MKRCRVTKSQENQIYNSYQQGCTCKEVALLVGVSKATVEKYIHAKGLTRKRVTRKKETDGNPVRCSEVGYMCKFRSVNGAHKCEYILFKGHMRGCEAECCTAYYEER